MNIPLMRRCIRDYGDVGYMLVGACLLYHHFTRLRYFRAVFFLVVLMLIKGIVGTKGSVPYVPGDLRHILNNKPAYTLIDVGAVSGFSESIAFGINNKKQVLVAGVDSSGACRSFLWQAGKFTDLKTLGGTYCGAWRINDNGQVVGKTTTQHGEERSFLWENGQMKDLGTLGGKSNEATAINSAGQIVGTASLKNGTSHVVLWTKGKMRDIGKSLPGKHTYGRGISDNGMLAGTLTDKNEDEHAFVYHQGKARVLPTLGDRSWALDINPRGEVVGYAETPDHGHHAFLYSQKTIDLGTLGGKYSAARRINNHRQVIGSSEISVGKQTTHAFLWQEKVMTDLNTLIPDKAGWLLTDAFGINDKGDIVGEGIRNGKKRAYLLISSEGK